MDHTSWNSEMNTYSTISTLFAHNDWARDKLLALVQPLDNDALDRAFEMGPGTLRRTLLHLWGAEQAWLDCWLGDPDPQLDEYEQPLSVDQLLERFRETANQRSGFLQSVGEDGLDRMVDTTDSRSRPYRLRLSDLALHVCDHGVHHRAQALNMLRHVGGDVAGLDYLFMCLEKNAPPSPRWGVGLLQRYYRYGDWANGQVYEAARALNDGQLDRPFEMGVGSLRKTLIHVRDAEQWWLDNWLADSPQAFVGLPADTSPAHLTELFQQTIAQRDEIIAGCSGGDLQRQVTAQAAPGKTFSLAMGDTMLQLCGHGTHHRAQALNMLRRLGAEVPRLDYSVMLRADADEVGRQ